MSQAKADQVAAILAPYRRKWAAEAEAREAAEAVERADGK